MFFYSGYKFQQIKKRATLDGEERIEQFTDILRFTSLISTISNFINGEILGKFSGTWKRSETPKQQE